MSSYRTPREPWPSRLWAWLASMWSALLDRGTTTVTLREYITEPVMVPAEKDMFDFTTHTTLLWSADGIGRDRLELGIGEFSTRAVDFVERLIRQKSRGFPPEGAERFQSELNAELSDRELRFHWGRHEIRCRPFVQVDLDEEVRNALRPTMLERLRQAQEFETKKLRIELVNTLSHQWSKLLDELKDKPHITHAAELTAEDFAAVLTKLDETREHDAEELREILRNAMDGAEELSIGAYEWAKTFDKIIDRKTAAADVGGDRTGG